MSSTKSKRVRSKLYCAKRAEYQRQWRKKNPAKVLAYQKKYNSFGKRWRPTSQEQIESAKLKEKARYLRRRAHALAKARKRREAKWEMADRPKPLSCEACGKACSAVYDHNHVTGKFRGWLCGECNRALGMLYDDPIRIIRLFAYLIRYSASGR